MEGVGVVIGSTAGERITLKPLVRAHADATDYWDGNWIECAVAVTAGGFRGEYLASLRAEEFVSIRGDLERLYQELRGRGQFRSMKEVGHDRPKRRRSRTLHQGVPAPRSSRQWKRSGM